MIYFIQAVDGGPIKIGFSDKMRSRVSSHLSVRRRPFRLLGVMSGDRSVEKSVHGRFRHLRIGRPEHFHPEPDLLGFIAENTRPWADEDHENERRDDIAVKVDRAIVSKAKLIAADRGVPLAELLSDLLSAPVDREYVAMLRRLESRG